MIKKQILFFLFCPFYLFGFQINIHQKQLDSLENLYNKGLYNEVLNALKRINFNNTKGVEDSLFYAKAFYLKANSLYGKEKYKASIVSYNSVINYSPNTDSGNNLKGMALFDRAFSEYNIQEYITSYNSVKSAESILSKVKNPNYDYLISIYADISGSATDYGYYNEAKYYLQKGLALYKTHKNKIKTDKNQASKDILLLYKSVVLYATQGKEKLLIYNLTQLKKQRNHRKFNATENLMYAVSLNLVGDFYLNYREKLNLKNPLFKAEKYLNEALSILDKKSYPDNEIQFKFNLAKKFRYSKEFKKALNINQEIIDLATKEDARIPFFLAQRGIIFLEQKDFEKAAAVFHKMISAIHSKKENLNIDYSNFKPSLELNHTGLFVEIADMILEAFPTRKKAQSLASKMYKMGLTQFKNVYYKEEFSDKLKEYYNLTFRGIIRSKLKDSQTLEASQIISEIESIENKLDWKNFLQNRTLSKSFLPDSLFTQEQKIREQLVDARIKNDSLLIIELTKKISEHRNYLEKLYPKISNSLFTEFSIADFQSKLKKNDVVLRYKFFKDDLYVFKITQSEILISQVDFDEKQMITKYISILKSGKENIEMASKLFKKLIPFQIKTTQNLFIVPDQNLHHLPFETLIDAKQNYLIHNYNISYASYLVFINQRKVVSENHQLKAFLPNYTSNLQGANEEVKNIVKFFPSKIYKNELASKNSFIKNSKNASILHLAMHAEIDHKKPELSHFLFSDNEEDKLYLEELYGLKLNSDLAVLSACNTGSGSINNNLALVSIQRAFNFSGVPSTVSSLWEIPDEATKEIMIYFYENLSKKMPKNKALRLAKQRYLKSKTDSNVKTPYYWAGLIVSGDINPISISDNYNFYWIIAFVLACLGFVLFQFFKK
ncbi:CHAT domain-containing protein [Polaribacter aestuariivivens]|uniref:CHAT domain-containing protein n=1 Tax=Polaribacter aestuariivivens TaxID=2304626 RepID=A0A5S3N5E3_9FLAO|nr:CHAT domain-containing protein [Polaribacter aestuariivivens]TMM30483.1 CHAT domain-containing protein [Polaribacter aestuariivivens]